jgi:hypothetical protein
MKFIYINKKSYNTKYEPKKIVKFIMDPRGFE